MTDDTSGPDAGDLKQDELDQVAGGIFSAAPESSLEISTMPHPTPTTTHAGQAGPTLSWGCPS